MTKELLVQTKSADYPIYIGPQLLQHLDLYLKNLPGFIDAHQVFLISNELVYPLYGQQVEKHINRLGKRVFKFILPDGEEYKNWSMAEELLSFALEQNLSRETQLIALGGGVVGDLAGFVASVYMRGIPFIQIPTTLLAQVDSSVGGKVAVNHSLGKNMIGSFYQPKMVLADLNTLDSLPKREWLSGLAEVIKYGIIWDKAFFEFLHDNRLLILQGEKTILSQVIYRCCQIKAEVVSVDEKEQGLRAILNFGHTIGHAIERATEYRVYRHGEAVAIGMAVATKLAQLMDLLPSTEGDRIISLLQSWGFLLELPKIPLQRIMTGLRYDKKAQGQTNVFILPTTIGKVNMVKTDNYEMIELAMALL